MADGAWLLREGDWITLDYGSARAGLDGAHAELGKRLLA